jgi:peptidyl-prolyl cis-trans isomerase C
LRSSTSLALVALLLAGCSKTPVTSGEAAASGAPQAAPAAQATQAPQTTPPASAVPGQPPTGGPQATPSAAPVKPVPATLPDVIAKVNGEVIQKGELEDAVKSLEGQAGRQVPAEERDQVYRAVLDRLVVGHVLLQESKSRKVTVPDSDIDARMGQLRQRFPSEEEFKKALTGRGLTIEKAREEMRRQLAIERMIDAEVSPQVTVSDQDVKAFYDKNPDQFQQPEGWRASHILIMTPQGATDAQKKEARAKIDEALKEVKAGGDFAEIAKKYSQDGSAQAGGDLNYFSKGQMVKPFEDATAALKVGEVSGVVETQFGYHVIKLTDKRAPRTVPLLEVNQRIADYLVNRAKQEKASAFVDSLRSKSRIEVLI